MIHHASADFWNDYRELPPDVRVRADKQFALLKSNPLHPSLQFKKLVIAADRKSGLLGLAVKLPNEYLWFCIGDHNVYGSLGK